MKTHISAGIRSLSLGLAMLFAAAPTEACRDAIIPGGDWIRTDGKVVSATEGGIVKHKGIYWMWGLDRSKNNSTFEGINLFKSTDLVHWTFVKQVLKKTSNTLIDNNATVERAKILINPTTGKAVMWMHYEGHDAYNVAEVAYATADSIDGDFVFKEHFRPMNLDSRDINVYQEGGTAYLLCTTLNNQYVSLFSLDDTYTKIVKEVYRGAASAQFSCEGHAIVKSAGTYFWLMSWCTGWNFNDNHYYTATNLAGPWTSRGNIAPAGANTFESQVGWALPMPGNNGVDFIFMGDRWAVNDFSNSRMAMLPMRVDGTKLTLSWYDRWYPNDTGWTPGTPMLPDGIYQIKVRGSGKFLQPSGGSTASGTAIVQAPAVTGDIQKWKIENLDGSNFRVTNVASGMRLEVSGSSSSIGAKIDQYTATTGANQKWHITKTDSAWWRFISVGTMQKAMIVQSASTADNAALVLGTFSYAPTQEYELVPVNGVVAGATVELVARHSGKVATFRADGSFVQSTDSLKANQVFKLVAKSGGRFALQQGGKVLQVKDGSIDEGAALVLGPDTGSSAQWMVSDVGGGWFSILNACTGKGLDVAGGATATGEGLAIKSYRYWATTNQQWKLKAIDPNLVGLQPNLSHRTIHVQWRAGRLDVSSDASIDRVEVVDLSGQRRFDSRIGFTGDRSFAVSGLESGTYLVRLTGVEGVATRKLEVF
ncbi:MAG: RICIN domain-containing protein [Fibrobacteres bacterium]|nr:RICIN domain-containing protein [Fibrobacterota bacterium]